MKIHRLTQSLILLVFSLVCGLFAPAMADVDVQIPGVDTGNGTLVSTEWLAENIDQPDLVILDCSVMITQADDGTMQSHSGWENYRQGHIPGAGFADLVNDLSDKDSPLQFTLPSVEEFTRTMGLLGVGDVSRVILYDSMGSVWAARVWWMLKWAGFDRAAILDGGLGAWKAEGRPLSTEPASYKERLLTPNVRPELIALRGEVYQAIGDDSVKLIDAMPESHYRGDMVMYDLAGHIPGASNVPSFSMLDETGRYLPNSELESLFAGDRDTRTITYCGGGISASSTAFILTQLGFTNVAVYDGSLAEWTRDFDSPMEVD
jgi:thiosulfate/3-mercaptopyruvate sulfurtransferase